MSAEWRAIRWLHGLIVSLIGRICSLVYHAIHFLNSDWFADWTESLAEFSRWPNVWTIRADIVPMFLV